MRNLKRVLSLALASIMLLGMMVVGASAADKTAADLTDIDKVTNTEAVNLMVDLKIIEGKPDGTFAPTETVDRATMAKLITLIMMGDVDSDTFAGTTTDLKDVPNNNWAKGFINYCYSNNIIAGDGKGNFFPATKVKVVEAAKMLLVALGYDAADRGYVGDNWSVNIMKDAKNKGLLDGFDANKAQNELTRDNAAQMIFNALMATTVTAKYDRDMGEKYVSGYTEGNTLGYETYSMVKITAKVDSISDGKAQITVLGKDTPDGIIAANVNNKIAASTSTIGQNVSIYVKATLKFDKNGDVTGATFKDIYTSSIQNSTSTLLATSTKGLTIQKLTEKKIDSKTNKSYLVSLDEDSVSYFINGTLQENGAADLDKIAAKGVVVEFYDVNGDGLADVVKATQKKVATLTADPKERTNSDGDVEVLLKGISNSYVTAAGYEDLSEDDVVLYYKDSANVYHVELADSFTGKVTAVNSDGAVRVDGTYYSASGMAVNVLKNWDDFDNEYTFYTDNGGYIVKADTTGEKTSDKYAIVLETAWVSGGGVGASKYMEAKVLFSDGTTEIVKINKIGGKTVVAPGTEDIDSEKEVEYAPLTAKSGFYTYTVKSDKYQLTAADSTSITNAGISATAKFDGTNTANAKTIFVVEKGKGDDKTYTAYTGFNNLPKMVKASGQVVKNGTVATYVFLTTEAFSDDAPSGLFYIKNTDKYSKDSKGNYGYEGYNADGTKDTLWVDGALTTGQKGFFTVGVLTDGIATTGNVTLKTLTELKAIGNDIVEVVDPSDANKTVVKTYDNDTVFVVAEMNKDGGLVDVTTADPSNYDLDTDGYEYKGVVLFTNDLASYIYVVATEKAPKA